ncbi:alpha/beta hydrolase [Mycobacterium sp. WMMD1722]|uniref:alpha/beta hydrolase n=1 Tax=Mycobacterium sp. WMMD1722 TaxID=3404117 RepID=UPI003BF4C57B
MPVTVDEIEASRPDALAHTAADLSRSAAALRERIDAQQAALDALRTGWQGGACAAAVAGVVPSLHRMQGLQEGLARLATTFDGGRRLVRRRDAVLDTAAGLQQQGWRVSPNGTVSAEPDSLLASYAATGPLAAMRVRQLAAAGSATMTALLADFDAADRRLGRDIRAAVAGLGGQLPETPPPAEPTIPVGAGPDAVRRWWDALSDADRRRLLSEQPARIGNLAGVPVAVRSEANVAVLNADIARVENATVAIPHEQMVRYENAVAVRAALRAHHARTGAPTFLYVYAPGDFAGQGRAAITIGDPDRAANTTILVPGTGNSVASGWLGGDDVAGVYNEIAAADPARTAAVVAWMGYDAPDALTDSRVADVGLARAGGDLLAGDVNALATTHRGDSHVTVIGHSYGSTTVADAAAGSGMRTDDVILVGSPGTDLARSAADFHLPAGGHLFVGAASTDPVSHLGGLPQLPIPGTDVVIALGADPATDGFGSTRFRAEVAGLTDPISDHGQYFRPGSESLFSIATIASGNGDALQGLGMTAPHRDRFPFTLPGLEALGLDPETWRPGTGGHTYR